MKWEDVKGLSSASFKRATGVQRPVFLEMAAVVREHKSSVRKHPSRGKPPKLTLEDKLLLMLMYYREYRTQFHIGMTYGIGESTVCEIIREMEDILIADKRFHLPGKKQLLDAGSQIEVVLFDVTESPVERPKKNNGKIIQAKRNAIPRKHS